MRNPFRTNEQIRAAEVRVIDAEGKQVGVMETAKALALAREKGLDLVEIAPQVKPPVVRITDYRRFLFQEEQKQKAARKGAKSELKELRFRPNIGENDLRIRIERAEEFLKEGDRVKLTVVFRGREITHPEVGLEKIKRAHEALKEVGTPEADPLQVGRTYEVTFIPKKHG